MCVAGNGGATDLWGYRYPPETWAMKPGDQALDLGRWQIVAGIAVRQAHIAADHEGAQARLGEAFCLCDAEPADHLHACAAGPWCGTMMSEKTSRGNSEPARLNSSRTAQIDLAEAGPRHCGESGVRRQVAAEQLNFRLA